jgi:membrane protease YdiL (CAAX protease family)
MAEKQRTRYGLLSLLCLLTLCDTWLFRSSGLLYLFGAIAANAGLFAVYKFSRLNLSDIGLGRATLRYGTKMALAVAAAIVAVLTGVYLIDADLFNDPRYHHPLGVAIYTALVILPLKTVIFEELVFRGVLFAQIKRLSSARYALIGSSVLFGLWHLPTAGGVNGGLQGNDVTLPGFLILLGVFLATTTAGLALGYLRRKSDSLVVSIAGHWAINATAVILAALSWQ